MKKLFFAVFALAMTAGCTKDAAKDAGNVVACAVQDVVTTTTAVAIAAPDVLNCQDTAAIKAFLNEKASGLNICKKDEAPATTQGLVSAKSAIGDLVCATLVTSLEMQINSAIPADWKCAGGKITAEAKAKILEKCQQAL